MDTGGERKTTGEESEWAEPWRRFKATTGGEGRYSSRGGGRRRWDVDLGSAHDGGWSRSRYHPLIGPIEGANPTSSPLVRTAWEDGKRSPELQKRPAR